MPYLMPCLKRKHVTSTRRKFVRNLILNFVNFIFLSLEIYQKNIPLNRVLHGEYLSVGYIFVGVVLRKIYAFLKTYTQKFQNIFYSKLLFKQRLLDSN